MTNVSALAGMIRGAGIDYQGLPDTPFDPFLNLTMTGGSVNFGSAGGATEAAVRWAGPGRRRTPVAGQGAPMSCGGCSTAAPPQPAPACLPKSLLLGAPLRRRTLYELATGEALGPIEWAPVEGVANAKQASVTLDPSPGGPLHNEEARRARLQLGPATGGRLRACVRLVRGCLLASCPTAVLCCALGPPGCLPAALRAACGCCERAEECG